MLHPRALEPKIMFVVIFPHQTYGVSPCFDYRIVASLEKAKTIDALVFLWKNAAPQGPSGAEDPFGSILPCQAYCVSLYFDYPIGASWENAKTIDALIFL